MDTINILEQFGISNKGAQIYLATLELGLCTASQISHKTKIQRTLVYDLIKKLIAQGLINTVIKDKINLFTAISPDLLLEIEEQKINRLKKSLPEFQAIYNTRNKKTKVSYYEGKDGIDLINNDSLKHKGELVAFTSPLYVTFRQKYIEKEYAERRKSVGNRARIIGEQSPEVIELKRKDGESMRETKILPKEIFSSNIEIGIYGDKVCIVDYKDEFGLIIEGQSISRTLKKIFEIVWNNADKI